MRCELLQAEGDALLLVVEVEDDHVDLLVEFHDLMRIVHTTPGEVCDMDESVHTTEVNEYTVGGDVLDGTFKDLSLFEFADDFLLLGFQLGLDECLVGNHYVAEFLVDLNHLEFHGLAYELVVVAYGVNVNLAAGQEGFETEDVDDHAAFGTALDVALDDFLVVEGFVDAIPALGEASLLVGEHELTFLVLGVLYVHLYGVAHLDVGVVAELRSGDDAVALVADVHDHFLLVGADDSALDHLMLGHFVERLVVGFVKLFLADFDSRAVFKLIPVEVGQRLHVLC